MANDDRPVARITPYRDDPYLLRGAFELIDQDGNLIETHRSTMPCAGADAHGRGRSATEPTS